MCVMSHQCVDIAVVFLCCIKLLFKKEVDTCLLLPTDINQ